MAQVFDKEINKKENLGKKEYQDSRTDELYFEDENLEVDKSFEKARNEVLFDIDDEQKGKLFMNTSIL